MTPGNGKQSDKGCIYFMRREDGVGPVKIGCSRVPKNRLREYQKWSPEKLKIIATAPGTFADEQRLHRQFADARLHHEWFEASPPVLSVVAKVAATGELPPASEDDRDRRIEALYRSGRTLQEIGEEYGVTRERIRQLLRKMGVPSYGHRYGIGKRKSKALLRKQEVLSLASSGTTVIEIARAIGSDPISVRRLLKEIGVKETPAKRGARFKPHVELRSRQIVEDYRAGLRTVDICRKHGVCPPEIYRSLKRFGGDQLRRPRSVA